MSLKRHLTQLELMYKIFLKNDAQDKLENYLHIC